MVEKRKEIRRRFIPTFGPSGYIIWDNLKEEQVSKKGIKTAYTKMGAAANAARKLNRMEDLSK
jgi:hypothetical protein